MVRHHISTPLRERGSGGDDMFTPLVSTPHIGMGSRVGDLSALFTVSPPRGKTKRREVELEVSSSGYLESQ